MKYSCSLKLNHIFRRLYHTPGHANGYFVLVITVKSSPLSNRYIATRVDVQVLAEDDTNAAVSGLSAGDFVITTSNRPVESGHQVRMVENP